MTSFSLGNFLLGLVGAAPATQPISPSAKLEAVIDSAGNLWIVKQGTPVPHGVKSAPFPGTYATLQGTTISETLAKVGATAAQSNPVMQALDDAEMQANGLLVAISPTGNENQPGQASTIAGAAPTQSAGGDVQGVGVTAQSVGLPSVGSIFGFLATLGFWKGIGLVLAGVLIIIFAALELRKLA